MNDIQSNILAKKYGLLLIGFLISGIILILFCIISHESWVNGLYAQTEKVIDEKFSGEYVLGDYVPFDSGLSLNGAAFDLKNNTGGVIQNEYAVITKIVTIYGPIVCVFVCTTKGVTNFIGFASLPKKLAEQFDSPVLSPQIKYWEKHLPTVTLRKGVL